VNSTTVLHKTAILLVLFMDATVLHKMKYVYNLKNNYHSVNALAIHIFYITTSGVEIAKQISVISSSNCRLSVR